MKNKTQYQVGFAWPSSLLIRERVAAVFAATGYGVCALVEEEGKGWRTAAVYLLDKKQADALYVLLNPSPIAGASVFRRIHREKDWSTRWKDGWKPFPLTRKIQIIPLWQKIRSCPRGKTPLFLDTTNAFGTGLHETTRFTAQTIERQAGKFSSFLDVGTGSGILAIVALKYGAKKCVGIDIDPGAVKVARQNLKANHLSCVLKACDVKDYRPTMRFDLVAANLVSADLIGFRDQILSFVCPGGYLVISGISLENIPRVERSFLLAGVRPVRIRKGREWSAMEFQI